MSKPHPDRWNGAPHGGPPMQAKNGSDVDEIRHRMAAVRSELQRDAQRVSSTVQQASNWEFYVKKFPYACAGLALVVGYSLVPASRPKTVVATDDQIKKLADEGKLHVVADPQPKQQASMGGKLALAVGTVAARAVMAYLGKQVGEQVERVARPAE